MSPRSTYKIQVRHTSIYGNTEWSVPKTFITSIEPEKEKFKRVKLFARGTSAVNHDEAIIMVDDHVILQKSDFKGLYLVVLNRLTLEKTASASTPSTISTTLAGLDEESIIILVSCNTWEDTFSIDLGNQLQRFGGFYIKEFQFQYTRQFSEHTRQRDLRFTDIAELKNMYHPFAFIGIKGMSPGMAFESIRSNQGYYMSPSPQPPAELTVFLSYNILTHRYVFDQLQVERQLKMNEDYKIMHKNKDRSLMNLIQYLAAINITVDMTALGAGFTNTFYDDSVLLSGETTQRIDANGTVIISGVALKTKPYYTYLHNYVYNYKECPAPYTDYTNTGCYNISSLGTNIPPIFQ